jgi:TPR repeat protein
MLSEASLLGDELAMNYLGAYYYNHENNYAKAVELFKKASEKGTCERGLCNLAMCYESGIDGFLEKDYN